MDFNSLIGIIGSVVLVTGAAWPDPKKIKHPTQSIKNWLFAIGGVVMLAYSILGYLDGGPIFFVILELLVIVSNILMMLDTSDKTDIIVIGTSGTGLIAWSLYLFEGYQTLLFIGGLVVISLGYAFTMGTRRRSMALMVGSLLIAFFSYLEASWIFFWLNSFFALFSGYYVLTYTAFLGHLQRRPELR